MEPPHRKFLKPQKSSKLTLCTSFCENAKKDASLNWCEMECRSKAPAALIYTKEVNLKHFRVSYITSFQQELLRAETLQPRFAYFTSQY